ncbi:beta-ketoacyl synthase N-terminal-like domain-containing protein [Streptomyces herbicida]|uniref:beta-ketoacyl synthase N-terminal-like domain-containing protein n=1 Tax=Streptomyces herbicida TaxID=3065675 RepID=UPI0029303CD6|nr:beta-ketoacyl synthase N-terminal-like domain-containing protein [Streptomyces sp. NEAU-HV9]
MDNREILTRFKDGTLERRHALALLAGARDTPAVPRVLPVPSAAVPSVATAAPTVRPEPLGSADPPADSPSAGWCAVVGLQGRWPGADGPDAFWEAELRARGAAVRDSAPGAMDAVDPDPVGADPGEAARMDSRERQLLSGARQVLEGAGYAGARLDALTGPDGERRNVGVFAAAGAARLSRVLDLRGPSQDVDTGPSTFLTALHLALGALRAGECAAALVAATEPGAGGTTAVLLKPLAAARAAGDVVHAVVPASAVGHPGRGAHPALRDRLRHRALHAAGTPAAQVQVEEDGYGSGAAGAGQAAATALTRAVLQLRHATLLPGPGRPRPAVWEAGRALDGGTVPRTVLVGVYAPDAQHAVVVLREPDPSPVARVPGDDDGGPHLVLLSAATPGHLAATAERLAAWLTDRERVTGPGAPALAAVARELRLGRAALDCRLALVVYDTAQLATALAAFAARNGPQDPPDGPPVHSADLRDPPTEPLLLAGLPETRAYVDALWQGRRFEQLIRLWLAGVDVLGAGRAHLAGPVTELPPSAVLPRGAQT